jgi:hypothetical protein
MTQEDCVADINFHIDRRNHKSAQKNKIILNNLISDDVKKGFTLPIRVDTIRMLPNAALAPLGCTEQTSINKKGEKALKYRMTHDQSFPGPSGLLVNKRVKTERLPPYMYSFVLSQIIHYIEATCKCFPFTKIYICKFAIDATYWQCHLAHDTATECLTIHDDIAFMALRLTFGGAPWLISDTMIDISNMLINNEHWNHNSLFDPISENIVAPLDLPESIPFTQAQELMIKLPENDLGYADIYIDNSIGVAPDIHDAPTHVNRTILLAIRQYLDP